MMNNLTVFPQASQLENKIAEATEQLKIFKQQKKLLNSSEKSLDTLINRLEEVAGISALDIKSVVVSAIAAIAEKFEVAIAIEPELDLINELSQVEKDLLPTSATHGTHEIEQISHQEQVLVTSTEVVPDSVSAVTNGADFASDWEDSKERALISEAEDVSELVQFPSVENDNNEFFTWGLTSNSKVASYFNNKTGKTQCTYVASNNMNRLKSVGVHLATVIPGISYEHRKALRLSDYKYELKIYGLQDNHIGWLSGFEFKPNEYPWFITGLPKIKVTKDLELTAVNCAVKKNRTIKNKFFNCTAELVSLEAFEEIVVLFKDGTKKDNLIASDWYFVREQPLLTIEIDRHSNKVEGVSSGVPCEARVAREDSLPGVSPGTCEVREDSLPQATPGTREVCKDIENEVVKTKMKDSPEIAPSKLSLVEESTRTSREETLYDSQLNDKLAILSPLAKYNHEQNKIQIEFKDWVSANNWLSFFQERGITRSSESRLFEYEEKFFIKMSMPYKQAIALDSKFDFTSDAPTSYFYYDSRSRAAYFAVQNKKIAEQSIEEINQYKSIENNLILQSASMLINMKYEIKVVVKDEAELSLLKSFNYAKPPNNSNNQKIINAIAANVIKIDLSEIKKRTDSAMRSLGWTIEDGKQYLLNKYGKKSRLTLNDKELWEFCQTLESFVRETA